MLLGLAHACIAAINFMARAAVTAPAYLSEVRSAASSAKIACDYVYSTATDAQ